MKSVRRLIFYEQHLKTQAHQIVNKKKLDKYLHIVLEQTFFIHIHNATVAKLRDACLALTMLSACSSHDDDDAKIETNTMHGIYMIMMVCVRITNQSSNRIGTFINHNLYIQICYGH